MIWESNSSLLVKIELIPTLLLEREGLVGINNFYICHSDESQNLRSRIKSGMTMISKSRNVILVKARISEIPDRVRDDNGNVSHSKCHSVEKQNLRDPESSSG